MLKWSMCLALLVASIAAPALAQQTKAVVVSSCGTPPGGYSLSGTGYSAGGTYPVTMDTNGNVCTNSSGGGGGSSVVYGPTANGSAAANPPVVVGGTSNGTGTGTVGNLKVDSSGNAATNVAQIAGAAPSLTNPIWIANAEAADTTGTFTNGTQTTSVTNSNADGYATGLISINGTYATASGVFEESDDGGTTFYSVICTRSDGSAAETGYTGLTNTNRQWACPVAGNDSIRIRSTAVATGTVSARIGVSAPPSSSGTVEATGTISNASSAVATSASNIGSVSYTYGFNGTTWDQLEVDAAKNLNIDICGSGAAVCAGAAGIASDAVSSASTGLTTRTFGYSYNGTTWDRERSATAAAGTTGIGVFAAGQMVFDGTNYQAHRSDTAGTAYVATIPPGAAETCSSGNVANATVACTLAQSAGKTTYIDGFAMTSNGATASAAVTCTLTGTITGTMSFTYTYQALATIPSAPLIVQFNPPIPASTTATTIVASCPAGGTGAANATMNAWGGQR